MKCRICGEDTVLDASTPEDPYPCMNPECGAKTNRDAERYKAFIREVRTVCQNNHYSDEDHHNPRVTDSIAKMCEEILGDDVDD